MKKEKVKKVFKCLGFFVLVFALYAYMGLVLLPKDTYDMGGAKYLNSKSFLYEPKNTLDIFCVGNSDLYNGFSPVQLYKETGITSFVNGVAVQSTKGMYRQVKKIIKKQNLKMVIIDTDALYFKNEFLQGSTVYDLAPLTAPFKYHSRWKELEAKDFYTLPSKDVDVFKGYIFDNKNSGFVLPDGYMQNTTAKPKPLSKSVEKDFDKIYKLCKKHKIQLVLMTIPTPSTWTNEKSNGIQKLADKYKIPYIDMNLPHENFEFDYFNNFQDQGNHCNYKGARAVTSFMGGYLTNNFRFEDKRGNPKYDFWNASVDYYDRYIEENA